MNAVQIHVNDAGALMSLGVLADGLQINAAIRMIEHAGPHRDDLHLRYFCTVTSRLPPLLGSAIVRVPGE
jgi:hypothetical protein